MRLKRTEVTAKGCGLRLTAPSMIVARRERGLTLEQLGGQVRISPKKLENLEHGKLAFSTLTRSQTVRLRRALGFTTERRWSTNVQPTKPKHPERPAGVVQSSLFQEAVASVAEEARVLIRTKMMQAGIEDLCGLIGEGIKRRLVDRYGMPDEVAVALISRWLKEPKPTP